MYCFFVIVYICMNIYRICVEWVLLIGIKYCVGGYFIKNLGSLGVGDMLMGFLGLVILLFVFFMYW